MVFFVLLTGLELVSSDAGITAETLMANVFRTLIFTMIYAAIQVAIRIFRSGDKPD
ncbi:hypothetical protein Z945_2024 [Sulfitobacter noctilucae]|nr:hypothetical protein Z945_2024 [Sulfitobacter noctilucae]